MVDAFKATLSAEDAVMATAGAYGLLALSSHVVVSRGAAIELEQISFDVKRTWQERGFVPGSTQASYATVVNTVVAPRRIDLSTPRGLRILRNLTESQGEADTSIALRSRDTTIPTPVGRVTTTLTYRASSYSYDSVILDDCPRPDEIGYPMRREAVGRKLPLSRNFLRARTMPDQLQMAAGRREPVPLPNFQVRGGRLDPYIAGPPIQRLGTVKIGFTWSNITTEGRWSWFGRFWGTLIVPGNWLVRTQAVCSLLSLSFAIADLGTQLFRPDHQGLMELGCQKLGLDRETTLIVGAVTMILSTFGSLQYVALIPLRALAG